MDDPIGDPIDEYSFDFVAHIHKVTTSVLVSSAAGWL
jgi:hypothetical protein